MSWLFSYFQELQVSGSQNFFFFDLGFTARQDYFTHFEQSIGRWHENGRSPRNTTRPPANRKNLARLTRFESTAVR